MALSQQDVKNLEKILKHLVAALKGMALYPSGHPSVKKPLQSCLGEFNKLLVFLPKISFVTMEGILIVAERPFYDTNIQAKELLDRFEARNISQVDFVTGLMENELAGFFDILNMDPAALERAGGFKKELKNRGIEHIRSQAPREIYDNALVVVKDVLNEVRMGRIPDSGGAMQVVEEMKEMVLSDKGALLGLSLIKSYDDYLFNHSVNVSVLSLALAEALGVPREDLNHIGMAGLLHDIGKIKTSKDIIHKPGKLDQEEWEKMRQHPIESKEIISKMEGISELTMKIVYEHHTHFDQKGYPELPDGHQAHTYSQLVGLADTYDAMTTLRPYQAPFMPKEALDLMEKKLVGNSINPEYFQTFVKMLGIYPVGTLVRLDTNEIAVVTEVIGGNYLFPRVKVVSDPSGKKLPEPLELDLSALDESLGDIPRNIVSTVDPLLANIDAAGYVQEGLSE